MANHQTVAFHTLGCKLNFSETSAIRRQFEDHGFVPVEFKDGADFYIINTCSVTEFADRKCRKVVRQALKLHEHAQIIVTGCYAQLKPKEISEIPGVRLVLGAAEKFNIIEHVQKIRNEVDYEAVQAGTISDVNQFIPSVSFGDRTRSFMKVQDGCDYKCTFCTIPLARGKSRSDTIENIVQRVEEVAAKGIREVVLTGINLGDFGQGTEVIEGKRAKKEALFIDLIKVLDKIKSINRFRISSIEPNLCTDEIIEFVAQSERFMPHFHMPLQSGNDKQLKQMRRRYNADLYRSRVEKIKTIMPHACIGVDVIVGFPGETEEDFLASYKFINDLDVSYLHVFTYSERANTLAAEMNEVVPIETRRKRNDMLRILSEKKKHHFYSEHINQELDVLFEHSKAQGMMTGFTKNYIKVEIPEAQNAINSIQKVRLNEINSSLNMNVSLIEPVLS